MAYLLGFNNNIRCIEIVEEVIHNQDFISLITT